MKKTIVATLFVFFLLPVFATPDRGVWVIDTLMGLTDSSYIIKQYVYDNMQSHYQSRIQVFIIEKDLNSNKIIRNLKITEYIETVDSNTGEITRDNRSEDKIAEVINNNPDLFYNITYVFPIGLPYGHIERCVLVNDVLSINDGAGKIKKYQLNKLIKIDVSAERIIQEYECNKYRIVLIEFGEPSFEQNYYQKIIVLRK